MDEDRNKPIDSDDIDSNFGKGDSWYDGLAQKDASALQYADTLTYRIAESFMADLAEVEDWGCGTGGFKRFYNGNYIGIDGSKTPFADKIVDLCQYHSITEGILIRHVLEHDYNWEKILSGAVNSFTRKFCLILSTPFVEYTKEIARDKKHGVDVPDIAFNREDIEKYFEDYKYVLMDNLMTDSGYKVEHVYLVWRPSNNTFDNDQEQLVESAEDLRLGMAGILQSTRSKIANFIGEIRRPFLMKPKMASPETLVNKTLEQFSYLKKHRVKESSHKHRRVIYTAIFGNHDNLKPHLQVNNSVDFICFTDNQKLVSSDWSIQLDTPKHPDPRMAAKYYKLWPHKVLQKYDQSVWIDASFQIADPNFSDQVFSYIDNSSLALFLHPFKSCIYDEATGCRNMPKYKGQCIMKQVEHYRSLGYPENNGLYAGGMLVRNHNKNNVIALDEMWWDENLNWTYQDQLSFPYVLWKLGIKPRFLPYYLWNNPWGKWRSHNSRL